MGFSGCGIQRFVRLSQMGGREGVNVGEEAQKQEYDTVNLGFLQVLPANLFTLQTRGQPRHWLAWPKAKPVLAATSVHQQIGWFVLPSPFSTIL